MIVLLGQQAATDVEDAAAAGAGVGCRWSKDDQGRQRDKEKRRGCEVPRLDAGIQTAFEKLMIWMMAGMSIPIRFALGVATSWRRRLVCD